MKSIETTNEANRLRETDHFLKLQEDEDRLDAIKETIENALTNGCTKEQCVSQISRKYNVPTEVSFNIVEATFATLMNISPTWTMEVFVACRMAYGKTLKQIDELYEQAEDLHEQAQLLSLRLKALAQLRDLAPRQVELNDISKQEDDTKKILFDIHGITDPSTIIMEGEVIDEDD